MGGLIYSIGRLSTKIFSRPPPATIIQGGIIFQQIGKKHQKYWKFGWLFDWVLKRSEVHFLKKKIFLKQLKMFIVIMCQYCFFVAYLSKLIPTNKKKNFLIFSENFHVFFFIILINFSTFSLKFKLDNNNIKNIQWI